MTVWIVVNSREELVGGSPDKEIAQGILKRIRDKTSMRVRFQLRAVEIEGIERTTNASHETEAKG